MRSISLGFGDEAPVTAHKRNRHYRLWEIGTYSADWQIINNGVILLSKNSGADIIDLDAHLRSIDLGRFVAIRELSKTDVRLDLDNGIFVTFSGNPGDHDEYFHVFCPEMQYVEFSEVGWRVGRSDESWMNETTAPL